MWGLTSCQGQAVSEENGSTPVYGHFPCDEASPLVQCGAMTRALSTLLIAFAMLCAPLAMHMGGSAMASPVAAEMGGGCEGMTHHAPDEQKSDTKASCAIACAAIPGLPAAMTPRGFVTESDPFMAAPHQLTSIWPEAETPPPQTAPAI